LANYFLLDPEFPACADSPADLLRGQPRVIALKNLIQPLFSLKNSFNPPSHRPSPFQALSLHIILIAESLQIFALDFFSLYR
jgi:hypothetical protein